MSEMNRPPLTFEFFPEVPVLTLTSTDIANGQKLSSDQVANDMGYDGLNRSPHLAWSQSPAGTKSFAVTIHDPDAPTGSGFWHWAVFNINLTVNELATGAGEVGNRLLPSGAVQLRNDAGTFGYPKFSPQMKE